MKHSKLTALIFIALILGVVVGHFAPDFAVRMKPFAVIFLRMVKMIIAPLLFATLVVGIAGHGDAKSLGKIGLKTIIYFEIVTTLALIIGLTTANIFKPGIGFVTSNSIHAIHMQEAGLMAATQAHTSISEMVTSIFPTSIIDAMAQGNLLQIVVFSIFFALAMVAVGKPAKPVIELLNSVSQIMFKFTEYVMYFAPLGIFGAIASTIGANGLAVLKSYFKVIGAMYVALAVFVLLVLFIACKIVKISLRNLLRAVQEPALLAFTTASSEAAFPKAMEIMERFGVPKNIVGFVMPTGYTFNLDGSTIYLAMGVLFSSQIVGINLDINQQIIIMIALICYEVSEDVASAFAKEFSGHECEILIEKGGGKYQLDLWKSNEIVLRDAGILPEHLAVTNLCTCCNPNLLFSHRASHGKRGNLGAFLKLV